MLSPATPITSNAASITGLDSNASISIDGGEYQIDSDEFISASGNINNNQSVKIRVTSGAYGETKLATLTIGTYSATFMLTTRATNTTPDDFVFIPASRTNVEPTTFVMATTSITGLDVPVSVTLITNNTDGYYQISDQSATQTMGMVGNNSTITLFLQSKSFDGVAIASLTVGGVTASFIATTRAQSFTPHQFSFTRQSNVATGTIITSNVITITGIDTTTTISISSGSYTINGQETTANTISNNDTVTIKITSSDQTNTPVTVTLSVGASGKEVTASFVVTTRPDTTPDALVFIPASRTGVEPIALM